MNVWTSALAQVIIITFTLTIRSVDVNALKLYYAQLIIISTLTPVHVNASQSLAYQAMLKVQILAYVQKNDSLIKIFKLISIS